MKKLFTSCALLLAAFCVQSQTLIWQDNLENATTTTLGGGTRTPSTTFKGSTNRYFARVSAAEITTTSPYTGTEGSFFWGAEDVDNLTGTHNSQSHRQSVTWSGINITGRNNLSFKGLFATAIATTWDHGTGTTSTDHLIVEYRVNGGNWTEALRFFPNGANQTNGALALETTGDSLGDGATLNNAFTEYGFNIPTKGTTLDLRFRVSVNASVEELAIDNFRVFETAATPTLVATPSSAIALEACASMPSSSKPFTVAGTSLTNNVVVTATSGFEISSDANNFSSTLTLTPTSGTLNAKELYVRLASSTVAGDITGAINIISTGAISTSISLGGIRHPDQSSAASVTASSPICSGQSTTVSIAGTKGMTYTVRDQNNKVLGSAKALVDGIVSINTNPLIATNGPSTYTLMIMATVSTCNDIALISKPMVSVNPMPSAGASVAATSPVCFGSGSTVSINATNGVTYTVFDKNEAVLGSKKATATGTLSIAVPPFNAAGTQTLSIIATVPGCNVVNLTNVPNIVVRDSINRIVFSEGAKLTSDQRGATYQWKTCAGQIIEGATEISYTAVNGGEYAVLITQGNCSRTSFCIPVVVTDVNDRELIKEQLSVYPNPSKGTVAIVAANAGSYNLYDQKGSLVANIQLNAANSFKATLEGLATGLYLLSGMSQGTSTTQKVVVE